MAVILGQVVLPLLSLPLSHSFSVLDDREDVWRVPPQGPGHSDSSQVDQLLLVRPYVFFSGQNMVEANNWYYYQQPTFNKNI